MISDISPYELLLLSRPRPSAAIVTPYDLYSRAHQQSETPPSCTSSFAPVNPPDSSFSYPVSSSSVAASIPKKTHYISDIHTKHSAAGRRAAFVSRPLHE